MTRALPSRRVWLFGLPVDALTTAETLDAVDRLIADGGHHQHVTLNVAKVVGAARDPGLRAIVETGDLVNADGQAIVWASRLLGRPVPERVTGVDLMAHLIARAAERGHRVYFLGARPDVVQAVVERARHRHPGLDVAGWRDGYWDEAEEPAIVEAITAARPAILFVALSSPRQERFLGRWKRAIGAPFAMGVGGSFDVYAGRVRRAPAWMRRVGLESLYRVAREPRRRWRRYVVDGPWFAWLLLKALARR